MKQAFLNTFLFTIDLYLVPHLYLFKTIIIVIIINNVIVFVFVYLYILLKPCYFIRQIIRLNPTASLFWFIRESLIMLTASKASHFINFSQSN